MSDIDPPVAIQQRMAAIRSEGREQAEVLVENSRQLTDWRYYVKRYPWACVGIMAAVGYLIVPRRVDVMSPDAKTLERLAKKNRLVVEANPRPTPRGGPLTTAARFLTNLLMREAIGFAAREISARTTKRETDDATTSSNGRGAGRI